MNIFILDQKHDINASYHVDKHVVKIVLEVSQMLCDAQHLLTNNKNIPYKTYIKNHPCSKWVRASLQNYLWTINYGLALCKEYTYRYNKQHLCENKVINWCHKNIPEQLENKSLTPFYQAVAPECKKENAVEAYRLYYNTKKRHLFNWTKRRIPFWIEKEV